MTMPLPESAVMWDPRHPQSTVFHNVPKGEARTATLSVYTRVGAEYPVQVVTPNVPWLRVDGIAPDGQVPPFQATVHVDTVPLPPGRQYVVDILFRAYGEIIWREPVRLTVAPQPENSATTRQRGQQPTASDNLWILFVAVCVLVALALLFSCSAAWFIT